MYTCSIIILSTGATTCRPITFRLSYIKHCYFNIALTYIIFNFLTAIKIENNN